MKSRLMLDYLVDWLTYFFNSSVFQDDLMLFLDCFNQPVFLWKHFKLFFLREASCLDKETHCISIGLAGVMTRCEHLTSVTKSRVEFIFGYVQQCDQVCRKVQVSKVPYSAKAQIVLQAADRSIISTHISMQLRKYSLRWCQSECEQVKQPWCRAAP